MGEAFAEELEAQFYDVCVPDWEGELDFYRQLISGSPMIQTHGMLEIACGTGRVTLQLASEGIQITGLDLSPDMLGVARKKSAGIPNVHWVQADMRSFEIDRKFGCVISPGHSFLYMTTPDDQVRCLEQIKKYLVDGGLVVLHLDNQDVRWLADLIGKRESACEGGRNILTDPVTGDRFRWANEWFYEPLTQTATCIDRWEQVDEEGRVIHTWTRAPKRFHCLFKSETEHLLRRAGFTIEAVYGDFLKNELAASSPQMIWVASKQPGG